MSLVTPRHSSVSASFRAYAGLARSRSSRATGMIRCTVAGRWVITTMTIAERDRLGHVVRDEQHGRPVEPEQRLELLLQLEPRERIDGGERLVEQQQSRLQRQRARDADALRHAARQLARIRILEVGEADGIEERGRRSPAHRAANARACASRSRRSGAPSSTETVPAAGTPCRDDSSGPSSPARHPSATRPSTGAAVLPQGRAACSCRSPKVRRRTRRCRRVSGTTRRSARRCDVRLPRSHGRRGRRRARRDARRQASATQPRRRGRIAKGVPAFVANRRHR